MAISYILAQRGKFFHRFINSEFPTKWCGLWDKNKKYLDYFAIKINDEWLSKENQSGFLYNLNSATHFYELKDFVVNEKIYFKNALIISLNITNKKAESKNFRILFEFGANFRNFDEGLIEKKYDAEYIENKAIVKSEDRKMIFKSNKNGIFIGNEIYKIHYPSNQSFKCFIPKDFVVYDFIDNYYKIKFYFFLEKEIIKKENLKRFLLENRLNTNFDFVDELYKIAILNLNSCFNGNAFIAGYPWFTYYWSRDAAFSIIGASLTSMQDFSLKSLLYFFKYFEDNVPNFILENKIAYNSKDSLPLLIISLYEYIKNTGDLSLLNILKNKLIRAFEWYRKNSTEHGFIYSNSNETWMDTIDREGYCLEIQTFWYKALECLSKIFRILKLIELSNLSNIYAEKLKENILKYFLKDGVFVDNIKNKRVTINSIFPFVFDVCKDKEIFKNIESHLKENFGFLSLSKFDSEFKDNEYHKGASWYHLNALVSYIYFKLGMFEDGLKMLKNLYELKDAYCKNSLIEVYNAKNKDILIKKPIGFEETSYLQSWSASCIVFAIQKGLLGIDVNSINSTIFLRPYTNFSLRRKIGNDFIEINTYNKNFWYRSSKNRKYRVIIKYL
ncbi:MAG: amylo-alpha-1,6-glucosidase [Candidatus Aenigmatarchaeota archaeon]